MSSEERETSALAPSATESRTESPPVTMPGYELPSLVYVTVAGGFAWMAAISWLAFGAADGTNLDLGIASVLGIVFFAIPLALHHTAFGRTHARQTPLRKFMAAPFDTFTGAMPARQAWIEVAIIPVGLAFAATLIGLVFLLS